MYKPPKKPDPGLKLTLRFNLAWSAALALFFAVLFCGHPSVARGVALAWSVLFVAVSIAATRGHRPAVAIAVAVALIVDLRWLPRVTGNFAMFVNDHPLYQDSPGTIFVVCICALLYALPASALLALYWRKRRSLCATLGRADTQA